MEWLNNLEGWGVPVGVISAIATVIVILNAIYAIVDKCGKITPAFLNIVKWFKKKKEEKKAKEERLNSIVKKLDDVNDKFDKKFEKFDEKFDKVDQRLVNFESHYTPESLARRDAWMQWVNERADKYDESIDKINQLIEKLTLALESNTAMTEEMFVQDCRTIILNFASRVCRKDIVLSKEEFNRVFKVYNRYEAFLEEKHKTNGEIDIAYGVIQRGYEERLVNKTFFEDKNQ